MQPAGPKIAFMSSVSVCWSVSPHLSCHIIYIVAMRLYFCRSTWRQLWVLVYSYYELE